MPCFFRSGPFFGKVRFSNSSDPEKEHSGAPGRHSGNPISYMVSKSLVFQVLVVLRFRRKKAKTIRYRVHRTPPDRAWSTSGQPDTFV